MPQSRSDWSMQWLLFVNSNSVTRIFPNQILDYLTKDQWTENLPDVKPLVKCHGWGQR